MKKLDLSDVVINKLLESRYFIIQSIGFTDQIGFIFSKEYKVSMTAYLEFIKDIPDKELCKVRIHYFHYPVGSGFGLEEFEDKFIYMSYHALYQAHGFGYVHTMKYRYEA